MLIQLFLCFLLFPGLAFAAPAAKLTPSQEYVTKGGTEPAFDNAYWNNHADGIYVDVISGAALFSSTDKFDSGTGWPSFTKPINNDLVTTSVDSSLGMDRTEVKSTSGTHLGHVFDDGPKDKGGKRYCINSASLRFVPKADLAKEGYGKYLPLFGEKAETSNTEQKSAVAVQAKLLALYFYADWCPVCKGLSPKLTQARKDGLDNKDILFVTLNLTDAATIHQSLLLADALGVGDFVRKQGSGTGYVAVLDPASKKEKTRIEGSADAGSIAKTIAAALP